MTIRLSCPGSGNQDVTLEPEDVTVVALAGHLWARYRCPHCGTIGMRELRQRTADLLTSAGCPVEHLDPPAVTGPDSNGPISLSELAVLACRLRGLTTADLDELP